MVETNFREFVGPWESVFGSALAAALFQFSGLANVGLIAGDVNYGTVHLPWGSNLITNPLLSSSRFEIVTDGCGATRCDKVAAIAQIPALRDRLRVCWEGADKSKNCGECEKCRRTYLNFLATGSEPGEFLKGIDRSRLAQIRPRNASQRDFLRDIITTAQANGIRAPWVEELRRNLQPVPKRKGFAARVKGALAQVRRIFPS